MSLSKISIRVFIGLFLCLFFIMQTSCSVESSSSGEKHTKDEVNPSDRWPGKGYYAYDFSYNNNGKQCVAKQEFDNQASYCVALTSSELNNKCAYEARKDAYKQNCGDDFQETNIKPLFISGYDVDLDKNCSVGEDTKNLPTQIAYCNWLKNEEIHEGCFWPVRRYEYIQYECQGEFSQRPTIAPSPSEPELPANPTPEQPKPTPAPAIIEELRAAGIKVEIDGKDDRVFPGDGEKQFREALKDFIVILENNKDLILSRKQFIERLTIDSYTTYHASSNSLYLGVRLTQDQFVKYFELFDRRIELMQVSGIYFDFGVEVYSRSRPDALAAYTEQLQFFYDKASMLKNYQAILSHVSVTDGYDYWLFNRTLKLRDELYQKQFNDFISKFSEFERMFVILKSNGIKFDGSLDIDSTDFNTFKIIMSELTKSVRDIGQLGRDQVVSSIELQRHLANHIYNEQRKILSLATYGNGVNTASTAISALKKHSEMSKKIGKKLNLGSSHYLNDDYIKSVKNFETHFLKIESRKDKIKEIKFVGSKSDYYYGILYIGTEDDPEHLNKVLDQIK